MSARNVEQEFDALKSDFGKLSADLVGLAEALRELTGEGLHEQLARLRDVAGQANEEMSAAAAALGARGRDGAAVLVQQIKARPLTSLLVCFGLGLVIAKLIDR